jgi:hypothetical protein
MVQPLAPNRPPPRAAKRAPVRWLPFTLLAAALLAIAALLFVFGVLPLLLKQRCVAAAASQGITLTLDHVAIGVGEVRLIDATLALEGVPPLRATAENIQVALDGLTPGAATLNGVAVAIDGPIDEIQRALIAWNAAHARSTTAAGTSAAQPVTLTLGHLTWTRAFGAAAKIEMLDVGGDLDPAKGVCHLTSDKVTVTSGQGSFGPWGLAMDRDPQTARVDLELDPVVKGGPSALFVRDASGASSLKVNVASSPLSRLGIPAKTVGLASDSAVEGAIDFEEARTGAATLRGDVGITRAVFAGAPVNVKLALTAAGDTTKGLDVKQGTLTAGPLHATLSGTMKVFEDGVRLALAWRSTPVACADLAREMAAQETGPLGGPGLGTLAQNLGEAVGIRVAGEATASGLITLDSRDANAASFTMTTNQTCGLALF